MSSTQQNQESSEAVVNFWLVKPTLSSKRAKKKRVPVSRQRRRWRAVALKREKKTKGSYHTAKHEQGMLIKHNTGVAATLVALLKVCAKTKDLPKGSRIHTDIVRLGLLKKKVFVGNTLISMYAKCGALEKAQEVFDELLVPNLVSWNALIIGYAQNGHGEEALKCFQQMQDRGLSPNAFTFACIFKACGSILALDKGKEIHARIVRERLLESDVVVANALVDMYARCGALAEAQEVFDDCDDRDVVSWNVLIAGYSRHGLGEEALKYFEQMQLGGFCPDAMTFVGVLEACGNIGASDKGAEIHADIVVHRLKDKGMMVGTALVDMYAKCGALEKAQQVFDELGTWDLVSWNALIAGYVQHGHGERAISCCERMQYEGFSPNAFTFTCIVKACGDIGDLEKGEEIHAQIVEERLLEKDVVIGTALVDMYAKCDALGKAQKVFYELSLRDVPLWNVLIKWYAECGFGEEALYGFRQMQSEGFSPNALTFECVLKVCGSIGASKEGQQIHARIVREGFLEEESVVANALLDMYGKFGALGKVQTMFDELKLRDVGSWNMLIAGYAQYELAEEALNCLESMQLEGFTPDLSTFAYIAKVCGSIGAASKGLEIHAEISKVELLDVNRVISTTLVVMYANCGMLAEAQLLFDKSLVKDVVLWSALMVGYAQMGEARIVFSLFDRMIGDGIEPNSVTFTAVLTACCHVGLLDKGAMFFEIMSEVYSIIPTEEHYTCMVDLFTRLGHIDNAIAVVEEVPLFINRAMWYTLLRGCRKWGNMKLASLAFEHVVQLDENDASVYVSVGNIYATSVRQEDAGIIETMRLRRHERLEEARTELMV